MYTECEPYSDAFNDIREQFSTRDEGAVSMVRYDGDWYFGTLAG
jgi:hypothetical protein